MDYEELQLAILLGVDTGGTYTDAVLMSDDDHVIASAKALTTRHDLAEGIGVAVRAVLASADVPARQIGMASLSTTLATNALVEGQGGRVGLICIGLKERDLVSHGLAEALKGDPYLICDGGHDHAGLPMAALDSAAVRRFVDDHARDASAFAIAAHFATRNPAHEQTAAEIVSQRSGRPVSLSHQLSARLNGPKRAMTALLNARLIGLIDGLISRAEATLKDIGILAPLMVVRGDGALISAEQARMHPIETILSGPAASIVGARWLTGARDALVSDIGGTTTDIALLRGGRPAIDPAGARVGPYRTMVEAVAMRTTGLGGDSEVRVMSEGLLGGVILGPRRVLPISLLAAQDPEIVHAALDMQLLEATPADHHARFLKLVRGQKMDGLTGREEALVARLGDDVRLFSDVVRARVDTGALGRLISRGIVQVGGVTPTDASHVLERQNEWDGQAAIKALTLFARKRTGNGTRLAGDAKEMAQMILDGLTRQTATALLEAAFAEEEETFGSTPEVLARHALLHRALNHHRGIMRLEAAIDVPVIGLGASAPHYYPAVGAAVGARMQLPEYAAVANAIGAVAGRICARCEGTVTAHSEGKFRVHLDDGPVDFGDRDQALLALETSLRATAHAGAVASGAMDVHLEVTRDVRVAGVEAREMFVEATIRVEASGRPRVARDAGT